MDAGRSAATDKFADAVGAGRPIKDELIIDAHAHMGLWFNFHIPASDADAMIESMDAIGVDMCICSPHRAIGPDYRAGNEEVIEAADRFPGRILPYITMNPYYPISETEAEIEKWHSQGRIVGFKIHPSFAKYAADGDGYRPVWEHADAHQLTVLSHSAAGCEHGSPPKLAELAKRYPSSNVLVAHSASSWDMIEAATEAAKAHENVFLDLCGSPLLFGALESMVESVGAERILFGTDLPFIDPRPGLGRVAFSRLSDDDKRKILGLNAKRIFRIGD